MKVQKQKIIPDIRITAVERNNSENISSRGINIKIKVKNVVPSHRIIINVSMNGYFDMMWHHLDNINASVCFDKMSRLALYLRTRPYHVTIHVFRKVQDSVYTGFICTMRMLKTSINVPVYLKFTNRSVV